MIIPGVVMEMNGTVTQEKTASSMGSGDLAVFATPAMAALMEGTAAQSVARHLAPGETTVGTALSLRHTAATSVGMQVYCKSELTQVQGRTLTFWITAWDDAGPIGEAEHQRVIVDAERFMQKAQAKRPAQ